MNGKTYKLRFREIDRNIFDAIRKGKKKVETRAATEKYMNLKRGDATTFVCGKSKFKKKIKRVIKFKTIDGLVRKFKPVQINPSCRTKKELEEMYYSFPKYKEKIKKFGLIVLELK
jgi:ASC-1-like (ASCH) protein